MSDRVLVYGIVGVDLVFVDRDRARELARIWAGFDTWDRARTELSAPRRREILELFAGAHIAPPAPNAPFDRNLIPGHIDGDWPEWPAEQMLDWMPPELIARFGRSGTDDPAGAFLEFAPVHESALSAAFEAAGWACVKDDALVNAASGCRPAAVDGAADADRSQRRHSGPERHSRCESNPE